MVLILLLSPRKRVRRPRGGRLFVFRSGVADEKIPRQTAPIARATLAEPEHFFGLFSLLTVHQAAERHLD